MVAKTRNAQDRYHVCWPLPPTAILHVMDSDISVYLTKAFESLQTAESEFVNRRYNSCANRCYYAAFQAAIAALLREDVRTRDQWKHDYVQAQFVELLINRRKLYSPNLRRVLTENQILRELADYQLKFVTETQADRALRKSRAFGGTVQERGSVTS
jgi:uncharacterized protein (UPF0332 family)